MILHRRWTWEQGYFCTIFVKKGRFHVLYTFSNQNCNIISAYFLYFSRFANPVYNGIITHSIDVPHNTIMRAGWFWTIFEKKTICLVILSFLKQNFDNIPVYLFLSFTSQVYNSIPIHLLIFHIWPWGDCYFDTFSVEKNQVF